MIKIYNDLIQGSDEWLQARCGLLTASEMKLALTPTLKIADNDKTRAHLYELAAQRVTGYTEPHYINDDMLRGQDDEIYALAEYTENYSEANECGFITNNIWGFTIGYSPDGLVGDDGVIEIKSRRQKYQLQTIIDDKMPDDYLLQVQTGLLVSERKWCDFISYCGGMPMFTKRVYAAEAIQAAIIAGATAFEEKLNALIAIYNDRLKDPNIKLIPTERRIEQEITL